MADIYAPPFASDPFLDAVQRTLMNDVKAALKDPLMKLAEAEVDAAVDRAATALEAKITAYVNEYEMKNTLEIIIKKPEKSTTPTA